ncbi:MAG TPA: CHRD domain-containing protein [Anaeromyxobacter sp.]|nr:CHRD domain-containing protein [Anaeromyxobacter sp.]
MRNIGLWMLGLATAAALGACGDGDGYGDGGGNGTPPLGEANARTWVVPDGAPALSAEDRAGFTDGLLYYNAHTEANPAGEIRGQLDAAGTLRFATLDGAQETPAVRTEAVGAGVLSVDEASGEVRGFFVTRGLSDVTAAHVHLAARGTPGPVIVPMTGGPDLWVVPDDAAALTREQIDAFLEGELYFNAHTEQYQAGEIRGQLDKAGTPRLASLDGAQEVPAVTTDAFGAGLLAVDEATGQVSGFLVTSGLEPTVAHVHREARGTAGGVVLPLAGGGDLWVVADDAAPLAEDLRGAFTAGEFYYNAHTEANPAGEIRGQLDVAGAARLAALDGAQETPPVTTEAFGAGILSVDEGTGRARGFIVTDGLSASTAAHVHREARGTAGGIILPLGP